MKALLPDTLPLAPEASLSLEPTPKAGARLKSKSKPKASMRLDGFKAAFSGAGGRLLALRLMYVT